MEKPFKIQTFPPFCTKSRAGVKGQSLGLDFATAEYAPLASHMIFFDWWLCETVAKET